MSYTEVGISDYTKHVTTCYSHTTVPDKPSSHLATIGHTHTYPRHNVGQLSAPPCALRLCIKATNDSRDRTE